MSTKSTIQTRRELEDKLLERYFSNAHNMSVMEETTHFINSLQTLTIILLDASAGSTLRTKNEDELKKLIANMC